MQINVTSVNKCNSKQVKNSADEVTWIVNLRNQLVAIASALRDQFTFDDA